MLSYLQSDTLNSGDWTKGGRAKMVSVFYRGSCQMCQGTVDHVRKISLHIVEAYEISGKSAQVKTFD